MSRLSRWAVPAVLTLALGVAGCAVPESPKPEAAMPIEAPSTTEVAPVVTDLALPDLTGQNGKIAMDALKNAGFTNVTSASADIGDTLVILPENWTVASMAPTPGTTVPSDSTVIVTMTKKGGGAGNAVSGEVVADEGPATSFSDGTHVVGEDIEAGTYKGEPTGFGCYWSRLSDTTGDFNSIITNGFEQGPTTVTISESDAAFKTNGCSWTKN